MRAVYFVTLSLLCVLTAAGCAQKDTSPAELPEADPAIKRVEKSADSIQKDLNTLTRIRQADVEEAEIYEGPEEGPLAERMSLSWSGPLKKAVEEVSEEIDYRFEEQGAEPLNGPVLVTIDRTGVKAFEILQELGWKTPRTRIDVDEDKEVVRLTYLKAEDNE